MHEQALQHREFLDVSTLVFAAAVIAAMILDRMRTTATVGRLRLEPVLAVALLAAVPVDRVRNDRWVEQDRVSERRLGTIRAVTSKQPHTVQVVI